MITSQQAIQYEYLNRLRRQAMYRYSIKLQRIQQIRNFIRNGGNPAESPEYRDDYYRLMAESDGKYFIFDDNVGEGINLSPEGNQL